MGAAGSMCGHGERDVYHGRLLWVAENLSVQTYRRMSTRIRFMGGSEIPTNGVSK